MKLLFLDIDGVLNGHEPVCGDYNGIKPECAKALNLVLDRVPDCQVVVSSAWRYMVHNGAMTVRGFEYMLVTHGLNVLGRLHGVTRPDKKLSDKHERGKQIADYLREHHCDSYVVIDDDNEIGIPEAKHPFVLTDSKSGMSVHDATAAIKALVGGK